MDRRGFFGLLAGTVAAAFIIPKKSKQPHTETIGRVLYVSKNHQCKTIADAMKLAQPGRHDYVILMPEK